LISGATLGKQFTTYRIVGTNEPTSYWATDLPPGLSINPNTGTITGTAITPGVFSVTISAANSDGTGYASLVIIVA
jgi:hypothetical protein